MTSSNAQKEDASWADRFLSVFLLASPAAWGLTCLALSIYSHPELISVTGFWIWAKFFVMVIPWCIVQFLFQPLPVYGIFFAICRLFEKKGNWFERTGSAKLLMGAVGCFCFCYPIFSMENIRSMSHICSLVTLLFLLIATLGVLRFKWCLIKNRTIIDSIYITAVVIELIAVWLTFTTYGITVPIFPGY